MQSYCQVLDVIYPVLDEAANAVNQKQSIVNTTIGMDHMQTINFQVSQRPIISVRNELWLKLLIVKEKLFFFLYYEFINK
jgi:hypothetical protein